VLEILVMPVCFLGAGLIGYRLRTPPAVAGGLVAVGCCHLLAFLGSRQALASSGAAADGIHLASQALFVGGFVAVVWLAAAYPEVDPPRPLLAVALAVGTAGPVLAAVSGPTPAVVDDGRRLGPVVDLLPAPFADVAAAPLMVLPLLAVVTFVVRYRRSSGRERVAMRWPVAGACFLLVSAAAGVLAPERYAGAVTALFLATAPVLPLALAFGPVAARLDGLHRALADAQHKLAEHARPQPRPQLLAHLTPREYDVLVAMAEGAANPVIARRLHISLSSVEKHATSVFRKLDIPQGPEVHRRVAAVVAYRDALEADRAGD